MLTEQYVLHCSQLKDDDLTQHQKILHPQFKIIKR